MVEAGRASHSLLVHKKLRVTPRIYTPCQEWVLLLSLAAAKQACTAAVMWKHAAGPRKQPQESGQPPAHAAAA
jgi:hypothetical protein